MTGGAPTSLITDAFLNGSQDGADRQSVFQRAAGARVYLHLVFSGPLASSHDLEVDFVRPDGLTWSSCHGPVQAGWTRVWCYSNAPESPYPGTWTVVYWLDSQRQGSLTFVLQ